MRPARHRELRLVAVGVVVASVALGFSGAPALASQAQSPAKSHPVLRFGRPVEALAPGNAAAYSYAFSRDGTRIYTDATFYTIGGGSRAAGADAVNTSRCAESAWTSDGRVFGWDGARNQFGLLAGDGSFTPLFSASASGGSNSAAISADGSVAVGGSYVNGGEQLFVERRGVVSALTPTPAGGGDNAFDPCVSADGRAIAWTASYSTDNDLAHIYSSVDGAAAVELTVGRAPSISPDGASIAYIAPDPGGNAQLWTIPTSGGTPTEQTAIAGGIDSSAAPSWSADGGFLAVADSGDLNIYIVTATGGRPPRIVATADGVTDWVYFPQFSQDGSKLGYTYEDSITRSETTYYLPIR